MRKHERLGLLEVAYSRKASRFLERMETLWSGEFLGSQPKGALSLEGLCIVSCKCLREHVASPPNQHLSHLKTGMKMDSDLYGARTPLAQRPVGVLLLGRSLAGDLEKAISRKHLACKLNFVGRGQ